MTFEIEICDTDFDADVLSKLKAYAIREGVPLKVLAKRLLLEKARKLTESQPELQEVGS